MSDLISLIPITVASAIGIFIAKEIIEFIRRWRADARKTRGLSRLFTRECETNLWTIRRIRAVCKDIEETHEMHRETKDEYFNAVFSVSFSKSGFVAYVRSDSEGKLQSSMSIPSVYKDILTKYMLDAASLDGKFFDAMQSAYASIVELEHIRESLIRHLDDDDKHFLEGFCDYALGELQDIESNLSSAYKKWTGKELTEHRLR